MNRNEIIAILMENDSTVLSFPDRGPWGGSKIQGELLWLVSGFLDLEV